MIIRIQKQVYYSKVQFKGTLAHKFYADDLIIAYDKGWW